MELNQVESFVTVATQLHFGRAAQILGISQSSLSQRIRRLEDELGVELLARSSREVRLTEPGRLLLEGGRKLVGEEQDLRDRVQRGGDGVSGRLRIGVIPSVLTGFFPEILRMLAVTTPGLEVDLRPLGHRAQVRALLRGSIDLGVSRGPAAEPGIGFKQILKESTGVVARVGAPRPTNADPARLIAESVLPVCMIRRSVNPWLFDAMTETFAILGVQPKEILELPDVHCVAAYVLAGLGIAVQPQTFLDLSPDNFSFVEVPASPPIGQIKVFWALQQRPEALSLFIDAAKKAESVRLRHWRKLYGT